MARDAIYDGSGSAGQPAPYWVSNCSLEMTAKDRPALAGAARSIPPGTIISVAFLPAEEMDARIAAAVYIRALGFDPMPHISARRIQSADELETLVRRLVKEADAKRVLLIAGDSDTPAGPFDDSSALLRTGLFERYGIETIGIAGHPDGHPVLNNSALWQVMADKISEISSRAMQPLVVTQFVFDASTVLEWLEEVRLRGIETPVRIGVPGPAGIKRLLRYSTLCGVGASAAALKKYGISLTRLAGKAGPEKLVAALHAGLRPAHGKLQLHFYPFGGLESTVEWIGAYAQRHDCRTPWLQNT